MELGYGIVQEQNQKLMMTPELRLAIKILQYSALELAEYVQQELAENPILEVKEEVPEETPIKEETTSEDMVDEKYDVDWQEYFADSSDLGLRKTPKEEVEQINYEQFISKAPTLQEHLLFQLTFVDLNASHYQIAEYLIGNIDGSGYLEVSLEETARKFSLELDEIKKVLSIIQTFEPHGVGAKNLEEALIIQAQQLNVSTPLIETLIKSYLPTLAKGQLAKIARELNYSIEEVREAFGIIRTLDPKPGRNFSGGEEVRFIVPDMVIERIEGEYVVIVNDTSVPRLAVNHLYKNLLKKENSGEAKEYIEKKMNSALWLIRSIEQRRLTLYKVAHCLVKFQKDFLDHGPTHLKPLRLKDVANEVGVHESTVSRATAGKYAQTPQGVFELKYFFSGGVESHGGGLVSAESIKKTMMQVINQEDKKKPLSDQKICDILNTKGIKISRRTVAKYRDELGILSASARKEI